MSGAIPALPNKPSWRGAQLKHRDNFTSVYHTTFPNNYFVAYVSQVCGIVVVDCMKLEGTGR
jgi:hypothetical protein